MPLRIQTSSSASFLSKTALFFSSAARNSALRTRNFSYPQVQEVSLPRSSSRMRVERSARKPGREKRKERRSPLFQEFLKPTDSCEVQVIGGFVENQQMGLADQGPGEHGPALVSARKGCRRVRRGSALPDR